MKYSAIDPSKYIDAKNQLTQEIPAKSTPAIYNATRNKIPNKHLGATKTK